jgi:hypothetical protein
MQNPYEAPSAVGVLAQQQPGGAVTGAVIDQLRRTKGWVRFLGILGFIACGLMILAGIGMALMGPAMGAAIEDTGVMPGFGALMGVIYIVMAAFYFYPALKLNQYASRIGRLMQQPTEENLVLALDAQRAFWKYLGIIMAMTMILYVLIIVGAVIVGVEGVAGAR